MPEALLNPGPLPMLLIALQRTEVNIERGTSAVMGTTATVARLEAMCFLVSFEPEGGRQVKSAVATWTAASSLEILGEEYEERRL